MLVAIDLRFNMQTSMTVSITVSRDRDQRRGLIMKNTQHARVGSN
jgi:hypothetical protein